MMTIKHRQQHRRERRASKEVLAQAELLLQGQAARPYSREHGYVPVWSLVNLLAHSPFGALTRLARQVSWVPPGSWDEAVTSLAAELVQQAGGQTGLALLQHEVLIPLELDLLGGHVPVPHDPEELVRLVHTAIRARPPRS